MIMESNESMKHDMESKSTSGDTVASSQVTEEENLGLGNRSKPLTVNPSHRYAQDSHHEDQAATAGI